jgi:predicted RNase H-like nuclease
MTVTAGQTGEASVRCVGLDLGWSSGGVTGLAALDEDGWLAAVARLHADQEIIDWLAPRTEGPCVVAIDAPIVVRNATSSRRCEKLVGRYFGAYGASCHPANTNRPSFANGTRALRIAEALDLDIDPVSLSDRRAVEVYPHPAIVALFDLPSIVRYKNKPGRSLERLRAEMMRLLDLIESWQDASVPLRVRGAPDWTRIRDVARAAPTKAALRRIEDSVDAIVCAFIALFANARPEAVRVLGTVADGYILTPVTTRIAAQIDADRATANLPR